MLPLAGSTMRFAISIPHVVADGAFDATAMREYLAQAEALGFASAWAGEQMLGTLPLLSPLETLAYAAACTSQIRLGCAMFVSSAHSPLHLAKAIASLDQLSRGRVEVGLVSGGPRRMFSAFGVDPDSYLARFTEGLELMKLLWTAPQVDFAGRFWQMRNAAMEPKTFQKPHPPIWLGGNHPHALRRTARLADGYFGAGSSTTAQFAQSVALLREQLQEEGRDPGGFAIAKRVYIAVDDHAAAARERIAAALERRYGYFGLTNLAAVAVAGSVDDCVGGLREIAAAGAQMILLNPIYDEFQQMQRLATEVMPALA